jgi:hypothetical protein
MTEPIDDILAWSAKLSPWRQDCLRRLALADELVEQDLTDLLIMVKAAAGLPGDIAPMTAVPFEKAHFGGGAKHSVVIKGIANVENINRLIPKAGLSFCPNNLTVIYGRNGSGKSGFVRILRTACRTRIENAAKLPPRSSHAPSRRPRRSRRSRQGLTFPPRMMPAWPR